MSILLNGGSNPRRVVFNGTEVRKVVFDGVTVWGGDYPASLSNFSLVTPSNNWFPNGFTFSASSIGYAEMVNRTAAPYQMATYGYSAFNSGSVSNGRTIFKLPSSDWLSISSSSSNGTALSNKQGASQVPLASGPCTISGVPNGFEVGYMHVLATATIPYTTGSTNSTAQFTISFTYYGPNGGTSTDQYGSYYVIVNKPSSLSNSYVKLRGTGASFSVEPSRFSVELLEAA